MKVLVLGKGGREHALVWKLKQSRRVTHVYCAPGNAGTALDGENVDIDWTEGEKLIRFCKKEQVALVVVGPEDPLVWGVADTLQAAGVRVFGPSKEAARMEGSKAYGKLLMRHADVPTAEFRICDHPEPAKSYASSREYPVVVKADGLAAGKGVIVCADKPEAVAAIDRVMVREEFGRAAGRQVVIEKRLDGPEISLLALVAGRTIVPLPPTQDHKRLGDGDTGPNTGGMGTYCPSPADPALLDQIAAEVLVPTVHAMKRRRAPFRGLLFTGLINTGQGPRVLEYNVRFGDPETQPLLMRLKTDLFDLLEAVVDDKLDEFVGDGLAWDARPAVCVVLAAKGYPAKPELGKVISGLDAAAKLPGVKVFHAGTATKDGRTVTAGGRVLGVTALGDTLAAARARAYEAVNLIRFPGMQYRTDIAAPAAAAVTAKAGPSAAAKASVAKARPKPGSSEPKA